MRTSTALLCMVLVIGASCIQKYQGRLLPAVTINEKRANHAIVNRFPDYGDGHSDGCIVLNEMKVSLRRERQTIISGHVQDLDAQA